MSVHQKNAPTTGAEYKKAVAFELGKSCKYKEYHENPMQKLNLEYRVHPFFIRSHIALFELAKLKSLIQKTLSGRFKKGKLPNQSIIEFFHSSIVSGSLEHSI